MTPADAAPSAPAADHQLAADLAHEAGRLLLSIRQELVAAGASAAELKEQGDRRAEAIGEQLGDGCG